MLFGSIGAIPLVLILPFIYSETFENDVFDGLGLLLLLIFGWGVTFGHWVFALVEWFHFRTRSASR